MAFNGTLSKLSADDQQMLLEAGERRPYTPGNLILRHRTLVQGLFAVISGEVRVEHGFQVLRMNVTKRADGSEQIEEVPGRMWTEVMQLGSGDFFGEISFIDNSPIRASVFAVGAVDVVFVPAGKLRHLLEQIPNFAQRFYRSLDNVPSERLRQSAPGAYDSAIPAEPPAPLGPESADNGLFGTDISQLPGSHR